MSEQRVLIDALAARYGGAAYATVQLARHLPASPTVSAVVVITREGSIVERGLRGVPGVRCVSAKAAEKFELPRRIAWEALCLPTLARREGCRVVVSMSGMLPRSAALRVVSLLGNPVLYEQSTPGNLLRRWAVRRTARRATYIAAPSRSMAELASASIGRPCDVLPWGVDHATFGPAQKAGKEILCVADFYAHKRHDLLVNTWRCLPEPRPRLRMVGNPSVDPPAYEALLALVASQPGRDLIVLEHNLPLPRLVDAYRSARVFVMPSEHESFCMPLAESAACGVPAIARDIRSLRETGGAAARYISGDEPERWASTIRQLLEDDREHQRARAAAIREAAQFSWQACAMTLASFL